MNKAVADEKLTEQEKGVYLQHHHPGVQIPVDPQILRVSNSLIYQLTDYISYDILLQYIQELHPAGPSDDPTGNYPQLDNGYDHGKSQPVSVQIAAFPVLCSGPAVTPLLVVDRQMSYMRQRRSLCPA
ncbi:hypothetical protein ACKU5B_026865 [Klebsiella pneumoniae]